MRYTRSPRRVSSHAITRRQALRALGGAAGTVALTPWLASCGNRSATAAAASLRPEELDIETVVFVMMENRSFDHYFGARSLVEGLEVDGLSAGLRNPRRDGTLVAPYHMDLRCIADPPHGWNSSRDQVNGGANDGFVLEYHASLVDDGFPESAADQVMGYHDRTQIPFLYSLADEFVLCDQWFCSVLGPTWPNRMYMHSAQSNGRMNNDFPEDLTTGFTWPTIYDRLSDAGIDWRTYYGDLSFLLLWRRLSEKPNGIVPFVQFMDDARSGRLPPVCHVEPTFFGAAANDDHPPHDFARGQAFLSTVLHAIAQGPQWERSLVVITYDEHGGFFDHVPPPQVEDERAAEGFDQLGVRVPSLILSPWALRGYVSSALHEHSSIPAFLEWLFGLEPLTVRDAEANFFLDAIDVDRVQRNDPRPLPSLPVIDVDPDVVAECLEFEGAAAAQELAQFADTASIPAELDRRRESPELLRTIHRELIRMGGAKRVPSR